VTYLHASTVRAACTTSRPSIPNLLHGWVFKCPGCDTMSLSQWFMASQRTVMPLTARTSSSRRTNCFLHCFILVEEGKFWSIYLPLSIPVSRMLQQPPMFQNK
jgi:hypothetical protein